MRKIYSETLVAVQEGSRILAGLGLRGIVEAVCIDRGIKSKDLGLRIERLAAKGYISKKDAERLHGIRFLGNDAAHDIKEPSSWQIEVALKIVEHALNTIYVLEHEAAGEIETVISDYQQFRELLDVEIFKGGFKAGEELSLAKYLGRSFRRVQSNQGEFEKMLIEQISAKEFTALEVGQIEQVGKPPKPLQLFKMT